MKEFRLDYNEFYQLPLPVYECPLEFYRGPVQQMIDRYRLKQKSLLSIGSGAAQEEYWFHELGNNDLVLVDIDESKLIAPYLEKIASKPTQSLRYIIGDALNMDSIDEKHDILYFSSFTPDEFYRAKIRSENIGRSKIGRTWDKYSSPFSEIVMKIAKNSLNNEGFLIIQSYSGGPNILRSPHYLELCRDVLNQIGITLLDVYCWEKLPHVALYIGIKGEVKPNLIDKEKEITSFHGRGNKLNGSMRVVHVYSDAEGIKNVYSVIQAFTLDVFDSFKTWIKSQLSLIKKI